MRIRIAQWTLPFPCRHVRCMCGWEPESKSGKGGKLQPPRCRLSVRFPHKTARAVTLARGYLKSGEYWHHHDVRYMQPQTPSSLLASRMTRVSTTPPDGAPTTTKNTRARTRGLRSKKEDSSQFSETSVRGQSCSGVAHAAVPLSLVVRRVHGDHPSPLTLLTNR